MVNLRNEEMFNCRSIFVKFVPSTFMVIFPDPSSLKDLYIFTDFVKQSHCMLFSNFQVLEFF